MTMENDLILKNFDGASYGMLPTTSCSLPSSSGISSLLSVAFGGGTNSTAMLCGFRERGIKPDLILFADTGGELPETYEHVMEMDVQCRI
jgi:3'-phosphoadenosine 5'-phosphosulfate sulfotransferase (PAPS reductase)/FAD synthetase